MPLNTSSNDGTAKDLVGLGGSTGNGLGRREGVLSVGSMVDRGLIVVLVGEGFIEVGLGLPEVLGRLLGLFEVVEDLP